MGVAFESNSRIDCMLCFPYVSLAFLYTGAIHLSAEDLEPFKIKQSIYSFKPFHCYISECMK